MKKAEPEPKSYFHFVLFPMNHKTSLSLKYHNCQSKRWIIWTWICIHLSQSGILVFRFSNTWLTCVSLPAPFQQMVLSFQHLNLLHSKFITWLIWAGLRTDIIEIVHRSKTEPGNETADFKYKTSLCSVFKEMCFRGYWGQINDDSPPHSNDVLNQTFFLKTHR